MIGAKPKLRRQSWNRLVREHRASQREMALDPSVGLVAMVAPGGAVGDL